MTPFAWPLSTSNLKSDCTIWFSKRNSIYLCHLCHTVEDIGRNILSFWHGWYWGTQMSQHFQVQFFRMAHGMTLATMAAGPPLWTWQCDILSWGCPINQAEVATGFLDLVGWLFGWWTDLTKQKPRCPTYLQRNPPTPLLWLRGRRKGSVKHWLPCLLAISPTRQASSHVPIPIFVCSGFESRKPLRCVRARPSIRHVPTCWGSAVLPLAVRATKAYRWAISPTPHACFASNHVPNQCLPKLRAAPIHLCF